MAVFDPNEAWKSWVAKYGNDYGITIEEKEVEAHEESCKEIDSSENNDISLRDFLSQMEWNMEKYADALEAGGVNTTEDLAQLDEARLKEFGVKRAHIRIFLPAIKSLQEKIERKNAPAQEKPADETKSSEKVEENKELSPDEKIKEMRIRALERAIDRLHVREEEEKKAEDLNHEAKKAEKDAEKLREASSCGGSRISGFDFNSWDKYDPEKVVDEMDKIEEAMEKATTLRAKATHAAMTIQIKKKQREELQKLLYALISIVPGDSDDEIELSEEAKNTLNSEALKLKQEERKRRLREKRALRAKFKPPSKVDQNFAALTAEQKKWRAWLAEHGTDVQVDDNNVHRYAKGVDAPEDPFTSMDPEFKKYIEEQKLAREREERREAGEEIYDELRAAEPKFAGLHTPDQIKPGFGNTFMNEGYSWVQDLESVEFRFVVPVGTKARELNIRLSPHHIFIEVKSGFHGILLDKELEHRIYVGSNSDQFSTLWELHDNRLLVFYLQKWQRKDAGNCITAADTWWRQLFVDEQPQELDKPPSDYYYAKEK